MSNWLETGSNSEASTYALGAWLFLRLLGLIYLIAFVSLAVQIKGLAGREGILPITEFLKGRKYKGLRSFLRLPTLCWLRATDPVLLFMSWGGAAVSVALLMDFAPLIALIVLWGTYLSFFTVCRLFLSFQWDVLLLETGFLAIFLAPLEILPRFPPLVNPPRLIVWLFWWLLFRLMFSSGFAKLRSGDETWRNLTALCFHYQTQPLPTPLAWYLHQLPKTFHKVCAVLVLVIELVCPFLIPLPVPCPYIAAVMFIILMVLIELSGNYCFFNLLGGALCVLLLDDRLLVSLLARIGCDVSMPVHLRSAPTPADALSLLVGLVLVLLSFEVVLRLFRYIIIWPKPLAVLMDFVSPFHLVSGYGLFAVMTTERPEIIMEGSDDGMDWKEYELKWKPGNVNRKPTWVAPHQPRLDWQMWFAALGTYDNQPWLMRFLVRLLESSPAVLRLLKRNPFPAQPPRYIRAVMYDYRFTTPAEHKANRAWWRRERRELYCPAIELKDSIF